MFMVTKQFMDSSDSVYYFLNTFPVVYVMNYIEDGKIKFDGSISFKDDYKPINEKMKPHLRLRIKRKKI